MAFVLPAIAWLGTAAGASTVAGVGIGLTAYGAIEGAKAKRKAASAEDAAAQYEAGQLEKRAQETVASGSYVSDQIKTKADKILSAQRAQLAAGNADTTSGTAAEFRAESIRNMSVDQMLAMFEANSDARKDVEQAQVTRKTGKRQADVLRNDARATLITGAASIAGQGAGWRERYA